MTITQLENEIVKAINKEIDLADSVGITEDTYYDASFELSYLKSFVKKLFKEYKNDRSN
tara:strand:- start:155 stop:331 length:177 start_codon:yes stop_codon:yes gene_type:complete